MAKCKHCNKEDDELYGSCSVCGSDLCPTHYTDKGTCGDCYDIKVDNKMCKHKKTITTDLGFVMCRDCETILDTPTLGDLAYAQSRGAI